MFSNFNIQLLYLRIKMKTTYHIFKVIEKLFVHLEKILKVGLKEITVLFDNVIREFILFGSKVTYYLITVECTVPLQ